MKLYAGQFAGRHFNEAKRVEYVTKSIHMINPYLPACYSVIASHFLKPIVLLILEI